MIDKVTVMIIAENLQMVKHTQTICRLLGVFWLLFLLLLFFCFIQLLRETIFNSSSVYAIGRDRDKDRLSVKAVEKKLKKPMKKINYRKTTEGYKSKKKKYL